MNLVNDEKKIKVLLKDYDSLSGLEEIDRIIVKLQIERRQIAARIASAEKKRKRKEAESKKKRDTALQKVVDFASAIKEQNKISDEFEFDIKLSEKKFKRPKKYQYIDEVGELRMWAGVGRKPKAIEKALAAGKTLEDFLIE